MEITIDIDENKKIVKIFRKHPTGETTNTELSGSGTLDEILDCVPGLLDFYYSSIVGTCRHCIQKEG